MSSQDEIKNIVQGQEQYPNHEVIQKPRLNRQLTDDKWQAAAIFMKDQQSANATMTVGTFYGNNGRNTVYVMKKTGETLSYGSFTVPKGLQVVHNYGPKEYRRWVARKLQEEVQ